MLVVRGISSFQEEEMADRLEEQFGQAGTCIVVLLQQAGRRHVGAVEINEQHNHGAAHHDYRVGRS